MTRRSSCVCVNIEDCRAVANQLKLSLARFRWTHWLSLESDRLCSNNRRSRVPSWCARVILEYDELHFVQTPMRGIVVFPLPPGGPQFAVLLGVSDTNQIDLCDR